MFSLLLNLFEYVYNSILQKFDYLYFYWIFKALFEIVINITGRFLLNSNIIHNTL